MKKRTGNCRLVKRGLLLLLLIIFINHSILSGQISTDEVCSVVFTFSPVIVDQKCLTNDLFELLNQILNHKSENYVSPGEKIDNLGGNWVLSKNLSGIQFALFFPEKTEAVFKIAQQVFSKLELQLPTLENKEGKIKPEFTVLSMVDNKQALPLSIYLSDSAQDYLAEFLSLSHNCNEFLIKLMSQGKIKTRFPVTPGLQPSVYKVFSWSEASISSFFSAKFIGEQFKQKIKGKDLKIQTQIMFQNNRLHLLLGCHQPEEKLFLAYNSISTIQCADLLQPEKSKWHEFSKLARNILISDSRDIQKLFLHRAWIGHFSNKPQPITHKLSFVKPIKSQIVEIMPELEKHYICYSGNSFPRISTARRKNNQKLTDIAVQILAEPTIINEIQRIFSQEPQLAFPVNLKRKKPNSIQLIFHGQSEKIDLMLASLRIFTLNFLAKEKLVENLPAELSISIAAVGNLPPYILRGKLKAGWPTVPASYSWRKATTEDLCILFQIPENSENKNIRLEKKLKLKILSGKGQAELMAELTSRGLFLESLNFFKAPSFTNGS
jgi:hypothetical protein